MTPDLVLALQRLPKTRPPVVTVPGQPDRLTTVWPKLVRAYCAHQLLEREEGHA